MLTLSSALKRSARTSPDALAVACRGQRFSYAQFHDRCQRLATVLVDAGVTPGDRVAIASANCHRFLEAFVTVPGVGGVLVPLNVRLAPPEVERIVTDAHPRLLLTDRDLTTALPADASVVHLDRDYDDLVAAAAPTPFTSTDDGSADRLAALYYTGGTSGWLKGTRITQRGFALSALAQIGAFGITASDVNHLLAPMFHIAGATTIGATMWAGGSFIIATPADLGTALDDMAAEGSTFIALVPALLAALTQVQLAAPRALRLRLVAHGGAPITPDVVAAAARAFPGTEFANVYGSTEGQLIALRRHEEQLAPEQVGSCGWPIPGMELRVVDDAGHDVPDGDVGDIVIRGLWVASEYWQRPDLAGESVRDGWFVTGDVGTWSRDGVWITDRKRDVINSGGDKVYASEVEIVLTAHDGVREAAAIAVPHDKWGEAVHAVVVPDGDVDEAELTAFCRERLAAYKVPKTFEFRTDPLPRSGDGKILRAVLRAPHWERG